MSKAIWHDLECGSYSADLEFWRALAARTGGPILDIGAGTGRTALALAGDGHEVTAMDLDDELLEALRGRAG
ncbi:MAG: class I SAM-dependent methyltransferase, partial [Solirubrobacteraceae bacterium]